MFRPSAAPRWKITTRRLLRMPGSAAPNAARVRKLGSAVVPTTAIAPLRRKMRLVMDMENLLSDCASHPFAKDAKEGGTPRITLDQPLNRFSMSLGLYAIFFETLANLESIP